MASGDYSRKPWGLHWRRKTWFMVLTVTLGTFIDFFLLQLIIPVLPFMLPDKYNVTAEDQIQEEISTLLAIYSGAGLVANVLIFLVADRLPDRKTPYLVGLVCLFVGTIMFYQADTLTALRFARALQGASGAVIWGVGAAMMTESVGVDKIGITRAMTFPAIALGQMVAPVIGGALYKFTGPQGLFILSLALVAVDFVFRVLLIEKKVADLYDEHNRQNAVANGDEDERERLLANGTVTDDTEFIGWNVDDYRFETITKADRVFTFWPCLKRNPRYWTAYLSYFGVAVIREAFSSTIPQAAIKFFGFDSFQAGNLFLPLQIPTLLFVVFVGMINDKKGAKIAPLLGWATLAIFLFCLRFVHAGGTGQIVLYSTLLFLAGSAEIMIPNATHVEVGKLTKRYTLANPELYAKSGPFAQAASLASGVFAAGLTIGPILAGALYTKIGYGDMNAVLAAFSLVLCVAVYFGMGESLALIENNPAKQVDEGGSDDD